MRAQVAHAIVGQQNRRIVSLLEHALEGEPFAAIERAELYQQLGFAYVACGMRNTPNA